MDKKYFRAVENVFNYQINSTDKELIKKRKSAFLIKYKDLYYKRYNDLINKQTDYKNLFSMIDIYESNLSDYDKLVEMFKLYNESIEFFHEILDFVLFNEENIIVERLIEVYNFYSINEKNNNLKEAIYLHNIEAINSFYNYSNFIINSFINDIPYDKEEFYNDFGINEEVFNYCVEVIHEVDVNLYNKYISSLNRYKILNKEHSISQLEDISYAIENGRFMDNTEFSELEFIKRFPFKEFNFRKTLINFIKENNLYGMDNILLFIYNNRIINQSFDYISIYDILKTKTIVNGKELTNDDYSIIINYLINNDLPLVARSYYLVKKMYLNNELNVLPKTPKKLKTLIP